MDRPRCAYCGEIVGVYEPMRVVMADGTDRRGSLLSLRGHLDGSVRAMVHEACYASFAREREPRLAESDGRRNTGLKPRLGKDWRADPR